MNQVTVKRGTHDLVRLKGFWSNKEILLSTDQDPTLYLMDEEVTTADIVGYIKNYISENIGGWLKKYYALRAEKVMAGKNIMLSFKIKNLKALKNPSWGIPLNAPSLKRVVEDHIAKGMNFDQIGELIAEHWIAVHGDAPHEGMTQKYGVPAECLPARILGFNWNGIDCKMPAEDFLRDLYKIATMDMGLERFRHAITNPNHRTVYVTQTTRDGFRDTLTLIEKNLLSKYGAQDFFEGRMTSGKTRGAVLMPESSCYALALLVKSGMVLGGRNLPGSNNVAFFELGMLEPFEVRERSRDTRFIHAGISEMLTSSNIRSFEDVPHNLRDYHTTTPGLSLWGHFQSNFPNYAKRHGLLAFDLRLFARGATQVAEQIKWSPEWFEANGHTKEWCDFAFAYFGESSKGRQGKATALGIFAEWALPRFDDPWSIKATDLRNVNKPKDPNTFFHHCKNAKRDPHNGWSLAKKVFKEAVNAISLPTYPGHREDAVSPFKGTGRNPFPSRKNNGKTHRTRLAAEIHERMIDVLLEVDENGAPTFAWAKKLTNTFRDDWNEGVWCPSRWTALAVLLLLPLRKKQVRWLDQGLMDENVYDPYAKTMVSNNHPLRDFRYEDGETHLKRYGRPTGAVQFISDQLLGNTEHLGLFVNTNKTQLWNPGRVSGYELPWPDGSELLASDDPELNQHGLWLNKVYQVLDYQYNFVLSADPDPVPVYFYDINEDTKAVSELEPYKDRLPCFVPLFRDMVKKWTVERNGELVIACLPLSNSKIRSAYTALCMEVERRYQEEGRDIRLTKPAKYKNASATGIGSVNTRIDIHSLRVAGISRLIEMGIDPSIVQEFIVCHLTESMTNKYLKYQPWHIREKILEAILNGTDEVPSDEFSRDMGSEGWKYEKELKTLPRFREHLKHLKPESVSLALVEGGICRVGGKGDGCNEGGVFFSESAATGEPELAFGPVQGGCGNCIYFGTHPLFAVEQTFYSDLLLSDLRSLAERRLELRKEALALVEEMDDLEDHKARRRVEDKISIIKQRLEAMNHDMVPAIIEWCNRFELLRDQGLFDDDDTIEDSAEETSGPLTIYTPFGENIGLTEDDLKISIEQLPKTALAARIVEKARMFGGRGIPIPEKQGLMVERAVDVLLKMTQSPSMLLDLSAKQRVPAASMLYNAFQDALGGGEKGALAIEEALDGEKPLSLPENYREGLNKLAQAIIDTGNREPLTMSAVEKNMKMIDENTGEDKKWVS